MIRNFRIFFVFILSGASLAAMAQTSATTSSPYSRYGLGSLVPQLMPQNVAMGGISTALNRINNYNQINSLNPASYSFINLTTIDVGATSSIIKLNKSGVSGQQNSSFKLSHLLFGIPVSKSSALSFGLQPYSELGYSYQTSAKNFGTGAGVDTNTVNYMYNGDGGLSKAHIGYGLRLFKGLSVGANVSYIFGNLHKYSSAELPYLYGAFNTRQEQSNSISGLNYDYGAQYTVEITDEKRLTFGYSGSAATKLNSDSRFIVSKYTKNYTDDNEDIPLDTTVNNVNPQAKIGLPLVHRFGISYQQDRKFLVGVDYTMGQWSKLSIGGVNQGLQNTQSLAVGGQITPNANALHSYLAVVDYRFGAHFDKTYVAINGNDIKQYGVSFGMGLPLPANGNSFYKVNVAVEAGKRGTLSNGLIKENYINLHLGFTLNDRWFIRYKYD